jgi:nucleotide-binding universal stress UspA family protein
VRTGLAGRDLVVDPVVREGEPRSALLDLADELDVDTIAMATHGRGGLTRAVLGSVAEYVVQHATIPVLLVRARDERPAPEPGLDRLLVPLDGSALGERALGCAIELARPGSTVVLVRVERPTATPDDEERAGADRGGYSDEGRPDATAYLGHVADRLAGIGLVCRTDVRCGRPGEQILEAARAHEADLIVMATHGRTGPARWMLGSVADEVARHADRPILLVSARARGARASDAAVSGERSSAPRATDDDARGARPHPPAGLLRRTRPECRFHPGVSWTGRQTGRVEGVEARRRAARLDGCG